MFVRALALLSAAVLLMAGFASSSVGTRRAQEVRVTMTPVACTVSPMRLEEGPAAFTVRNLMRRPREFIIAGRKTAYIEPGRAAVLRVTFAAQGVYRFFCISQGAPSWLRTGAVAVQPPRSTTSGSSHGA